MADLREMTEEPLVVIVVLNWNGGSDTVECLSSLKLVRYPRARILVVDNGSTDGSRRLISDSHPDVPLIETGTNLGFAEGNNVGIREALSWGAEYVLVLNNDTVVDPGIVDAFLEARNRHPRGGVFGGKILYHARPSTIWYEGGYWDDRNNCFGLLGEGMEDGTVGDEEGPTEYVIGCAMFLPTETIRRVGLLEPLFFLNYEEMDYCYRIKAAQRECIYVPTARLWHKVAVSFGGDVSPLKVYYNFRNRLFWAERHLQWAKRLSVHKTVYAEVWKRLVAPALEGDEGLLNGARTRVWRLRGAWRSPLNRAWGAGIRDYWLRRFGECPEDVAELHRQWRDMRRVAGA